MSRVFSFRAVCLLVAMTAVGCDNDATLPTPSDIVQVSDVYYGPLDPGGTSQYLVSIDQAGPVQVMFAGEVADGPLRSVDYPLEVSIGTFDGTACTKDESAKTGPKFKAVLQRQYEAGTYCVQLSDSGTLPETVGTVLRVTSPPIVATPATAGTTTFASAITPRGRATRSVEASRSGRIEITLTAMSPSNATVGLGLGLAASDGSGCQLAKIVTARPGTTPQLTADVDAGGYCMAIYDLGTFATVQNFSATIVNP